MDKRRNNGGNSTKSKGVDRRKNEYKEVLTDALSDSELIGVIRMLHSKAVNDKDVNAARILIEHYLGKPKQQIEQTNIDGGAIVKPKEWV